jgi:poly(A) polymerase/tRNA nucleotidyltransferase (CCA-adding enzyme)
MGENTNITLGRDLHEWEKEILGQCDLFLVGGVVRDLLLGIAGESVDLDYIASGIEQERLIEILEGHGRADLVGKSFGVIKFRVPGGSTVDISMPRSERSTGPGHRDFDVKFDPGIPLEEDLARRDFTINSMALDLRKMKIVDPLGGMGDLRKKILRVNRESSFEEDPLRILRGVQFMARFGLEVESSTGELMRKDRGLIESVSMERIREELNKMMLLADFPGKGFVFMHETGILPEILPELDETWGEEQNEFHPDDLFHHSVRCCDLARKDLMIRWCALLHDLGKKETKAEVNGRVVFYRHEAASARMTREILGRLVFPNEFIERAAHMVKNHMFYITEEWSDSAVRRFIARVGTENIEDLFAIREADGESRGDGETAEEIAYARKRIEKVMVEDAAFKRDDLALGGKDVIEITGIQPGPEIGRILDELLELVLDHPEWNNAEKLGELLKERWKK